MTNRDKAYDLMCKIRYSVASGIHTYSLCSTKGCNGQSRGGDQCADCLASELRALVGGDRGSRFMETLEDYNVATDAVLRRAEVLDANG